MITPTASVTLLVVVSSALSLPLRAEDLPTGQVIEKVVCRQDAAQSYALYLPPGYSREQAWPILYALDARGRGPLAAERFRAGAERFGYVVASSNNSASDGPMETNVTAMQAMWRDTHERLRIDNRRVYVTGFSGGARAACLLADLAPGTIAGVIGCGAGFSPDRSPHAGLPFSYFGTVGTTDFNYQEMQALDATLDELSVPHRIETFEGGHDWPPSALAERALAWMEVRGMKEGRRPRDPRLAETLLREQLTVARDRESKDRLGEAAHLYAALVSEFTGLADVSEASAAAARLADSKELKALLKKREKLARREESYLAKAKRTFSGISREDALGSVGRVVSELGIASLKGRAARTDDPDASASARRLLAAVLVQTSFYMPRELMERKDYPRAILVLSVAAEIRPENPYIWYRMARAQALMGSKGSALDSLEKAVAAGFADAERLASDPDLAAVRGEDRYRSLLAGLRQAKPAPAS